LDRGRTNAPALVASVTGLQANGMLKNRPSYVMVELRREQMQSQSSRGLMLSIGAVLAILTIQGLSGDFMNLFVSFPNGAVSQSMGGLSQALDKAGFVTAYHAVAGILLVVLAMVALVFSFRYKAMSVRISSILALLATLVAAAEGSLLLLSGFSNNANSALMGYSYIFAYAFYFLVLYFARS
jgi:hypothetical protein